jgi:hypothetical protein
MQGLVSLDKYFRENESVYVQNTSGGIVSLTFRSADGRPEPFSLPNDRRPINLTDYVPKDMIMRSADFRKLIMRRPPAIKVLTAEEYELRINGIAKEKGQEPLAVVEDISDKISNAQKKSIPTAPDTFGMKVEENPANDPKEDSAGGADDIGIPGIADEGINPRVMQIVANCSPQAADKMKASDALDELDSLNTTLEDLNYVASNVAYKTVRDWAKSQLTKNKDVLS